MSKLSILSPVIAQIVTLRMILSMTDVLTDAVLTNEE